MPALAALLIAAAPALVLTDATGARHDLAAYRGKVVLVNFWATWCEPCKEELPSLERLRAALGGRPFVVLAVQSRGSARTARDTADALGLRFPILLDRDGSATDAWKVNLLPTSFLIGEDGTIAWKHAGQLDWSTPAARRRVEKLIH